MTKKEFLAASVLAVLVTGLSFFVLRSECPGCPDALDYRGWPLFYYQTGGLVPPYERWLPLIFLFDFLFWFAVWAVGWWVVKKLKIKS